MVDYNCKTHKILSVEVATIEICVENVIYPLILRQRHWIEHYLKLVLSHTLTQVIRENTDRQTDRPTDRQR